MTRRKLQLEVWNAGNTSRLAITPYILDGRHIQKVMGPETLWLTLALKDPAVAHMTEGSVLHLRRSGTSEFTFWRITRLQRSRTSENALILRVDADALWMDFRHGHLRQTQTGGRPALLQFGLIDALPEDILTDYIIPAYEGTAITFQAGVLPTTVEQDAIDLAFDATTPLGALQMVADIADLEWQFRLAEDGQSYYVDLLDRVGSAQGGPEIRYQKNLMGMDKIEDYSNIATRLRIRGSGELQLQDATWEIIELDGITVRLGGPSWLTGGKKLDADRFANPIWKDGALVGKYFRLPVFGLPLLVTASDAIEGTITVSGMVSEGVNVGDVGYFSLDSAGTQRLDYLEDPDAVAQYGVRLGPIIEAGDDVPDAINLIRSSDFSRWSGGLPIDWDLVGGATITESSDPLYLKHGLRTAHVIAPLADQGLAMDSSTDLVITEDDTRRPYHAIVAALTVISGLVKIRLRNITTDVSYPQSTSGGMQPPEGDNIYQEPAQLLSDEPLPAGTYRVEILSLGGAAEWYMDAIMVTRVVGDDIPAYLREPAPQVLWHRLARELELRTQPLLEYRVEMVNLHHVLLNA